MNKVFGKRIYTWTAFTAAVTDIFGRMDDLRRAARGGRVSPAFAEKIMLAVTHVNGCRYCAYGHSRAALAAGVPESEIQQLLAGGLGSFPGHEAVALAFAQHYAESACQPDQQAWDRLVDQYGAAAASDMLAYMRMITFGNLYGNTLDALLSRLRGKPAADSSLWSELGVILGVFVLVPLAMLRSSISRQPSRSRESGLIPTTLKEN